MAIQPVSHKTLVLTPSFGGGVGEQHKIRQFCQRQIKGPLPEEAGSRPCVPAFAPSWAAFSAVLGAAGFLPQTQPYSGAALIMSPEYPSPLPFSSGPPSPAKRKAILFIRRINHRSEAQLGDRNEE